MSFLPFLEIITQEIDQTQYGQKPVELYQPIGYIMSLGGKRLRPLLTVLSTQLFINNWQKALKPAIAVEVFHNFTLMHDDIMDRAPLRRGKPTVHQRWNDNVAILSGDVMLVEAYQLLLNVDIEVLPHVMRRFSRTAAEVCEGQQLDMNFESRWDVTEDEYLEMIRLKTSVLLGFALELGGIIAKTDTQTTQDLYDIGVNMGLGFQLKDDLLDVFGDPNKFGKQVGGDIIANKKTFLLIEALTQAEGNLKTDLNYWIAATDFDPTEKVQAITKIYQELDIKTKTENRIAAYFSKGLAGLQSLNVPVDRKAPLLDFVDYLLTRES
jgi:geranylgeranyl diphosphate synthase, type II